MAKVIDGLPDGLFQASLTAGYVASTFDPVDERLSSAMRVTLLFLCRCDRDESDAPVTTRAS